MRGGDDEKRRGVEKGVWMERKEGEVRRSRGRKGVREWEEGRGKEKVNGLGKREWAGEKRSGREEERAA